MCILSDADIKAGLKEGGLKITPFRDGNLTPNGLDLTVAEVFLKAEGRTVTDGVATVPPGAWFAISTDEVVTLGPLVAGQLWIRSSYARKGAIAGFGKVEAGFSGTLTIGAANLGPEPLEIPVGDRFCQIVFERMHSPPEALYAQRSGNYQGQRGVTLAPAKE
ncbi:MAG: dCTP deaminase [Euryarchaeota archaeon]|nr:dCTP deaminase [Euryarchaeota archaeon]